MRVTEECVIVAVIYNRNFETFTVPHEKNTCASG